MNSTIALNFIRSANAPQISAGVMMKNMPWKSMCVRRGISALRMVGSTGAVAPSGQVRATSFMNR